MFEQEALYPLRHLLSPYIASLRRPKTKLTVQTNQECNLLCIQEVKLFTLEHLYV